MSGEESESRSDRLRRRRSQRQDSAETDESSEPAGADETTETSSTSGTDKPSKPSKPSVKEEQTPVYMYLPESQEREIKRLYSVLKAKYEYEYDQDFEKNRHFYPLLVQHGLDSLDNLDAAEIRDRLEAIS
jgi:hypothetical protein